MIVSHATMGGTDGEGLSVNDICVRITALRNDLYRAAKAPTGVKPLEWGHYDDGTAWATTSLGLVYQALPDGSWLHRNGSPVPAGTTLDAAKAAAQADYEQRILSTLLPAPSRDEVLEEAAGDWVMAPREPTEAMFNAAKPFGICMSALDDAYRAMLAAAPPAPTVTEAMIEAGGKAFLDVYGDPFATWEDYRDEIKAALTAALEARS